MVGEGKGKSGDSYVGAAAERSPHQTIASQICKMWSPTPPHRKTVTLNIFTVLKCSDRAKRAREIRGNHKNNQRKQQPILKCNVFCHGSTSWYCPHSCVFISRHPSGQDLMRKILFVAAQPLHRVHINSETLYLTYYTYKPRA